MRRYDATSPRVRKRGRRRRAAMLLAGLAGLAGVGADSVGAQIPQAWFLETLFPAASPTNGEDVGVVSAMDYTTTPPMGFPGLSGLFLDYTSGPGYAADNLAFAQDLNVFWYTPGQNRPTGHLAVAKDSGVAGFPVIEFYAMMGGEGLRPPYPEWVSPNATTPPPHLPNVPAWSIPTASGSVVMAMDVATGSADAANPLQRTEYLITAETFGGQITLGAYGLTDAAGNFVQPALVSFVQTGLTGSVVGIAISGGTPGPLAQDYLMNEIVFVVFDGVALTAHSITFNARSSVFGTLNVGTAYPVTPMNLTTASGGSTQLGGIWIAQNTESYASTLAVKSHDIGISVAHPSTPTTTPGTFHVLVPGLGSPLTHANVGGGPLCHVPAGDFFNLTAVSPARNVFSPPSAAGPHGWYIVVPRVGGFDIEAVDRWGNTSSSAGFNFLYNSVGSAILNGMPYPHASHRVNGNVHSGTLWVPYWTSGGGYQIEVAEGVGTNYAGFVSHQVSSTNHALPMGYPFGALPVPPKASPTPTWPATTILADQKMNYIREHVLYLPGF